MTVGSWLQRLQYGGACTRPPVSDQAAVEVAGISFRYPGAADEALSEVSATIRPGERVALVGPNGAGKSTLLRLILGLDRPLRGSVAVYGRAPHECLHRVALVPQRTSVDWAFPVTVRQVVAMGRYVHLGWFRRLGPTDHERVDRAMETMEILPLADRQVGELSGGQQQRVMLARALAHDADLFLLDEPLNHVDIRTQELIYHTLESLTSRGKAAIVCTHDLGMLTVHFNRAIFIDRRMIADGPVAEVMTPETIAHAYGFEFHEHWRAPARARAAASPTAASGQTEANGSGELNDG